MSRYLKPILAVAAIATYLLALRYAAPSREPYFILGTGVVGLVAWLCGSVAGLVAALILVPLTDYVYSQFAAVPPSYGSVANSPAFIAMQILTAVAIGHLRRDKKTLDQNKIELKNANERLHTVLSNVREIGGVHNLCSECKSIQNEDGHWLGIDSYLKGQTKMEFSHCLCPACAEKYYHKLGRPDKPA